MHDPACLQFDEHKDIQRTEEQVVNDSKVTGPDASGVILQERSPGLARVSTHFGHVLLDRALANLNPQFYELTPNAFCTPQLVLLGHLPDQIDGFLGDTWLSLLVL